MAIELGCECGKRFRAGDHLAGKAVKCPACGRAMHQTGGGVSASSNELKEITPQASDAPFVATCGCGKRFMAKAHLEGQQRACPGCGQSLTLRRAGSAAPASSAAAFSTPANRAAAAAAPTPAKATKPLDLAASDPLDDPLGGLPDEPVADPLASPLMRAAGRKKSPNIPLIAGIGGGAVVVLLAVIVMLVMFSGDDDAGDDRLASSSSSGRPAAGPSAPAPPGSPQPSYVDPDLVNPERPKIPVPDIPVPGPGSAAPAESDDSSSAESTSSSPKDPVAAKRFEMAVQRWHQSNQPRGKRTVGDPELVITHYSWMCELLPYLGHGDVYNKFDFSKPWIDKENLQLSGALIPEFLNPLDKRDRWSGFPFDQMALTHFVGMSGVEDQRNVVAAMLPRTDDRAGVFGYDSVAKPDQITDGTSNTIMILGAGELVSPWIQGGGATIRGARAPYFDPVSGFGTRGSSQAGTAVLMADGSTRFIAADVDPQVFRAMSTIHGSETVDMERFGEIQERFPTRKPETQAQIIFERLNPKK